MRRLLTTVLASVAACVAVALIVLGDTPEADALDTGPMFGAYAQPVGVQTNVLALDLLERELGTTLPMVRAFSDWDDGLGADKPLHTWVRSGDRDLMVSIKPRRRAGQIIPWAEIAAAQPGSSLYRDMQGFADGAKRYERPMIVAFHHEPEQGFNQQYGSSEDFKAAFRNFRSVFDREGVTNVHFAWVMTEWSYEVGRFDPTDRRRAEAWYPGDDVIDMIASDTYNWNNCREGKNEPWTSLEDKLEPFMEFSSLHPDKPLILGEFASDEGTEGQKAAWLEEAQALFKKAPYRDAFAAVLYFHDDGVNDRAPGCDWWLDTSRSSLEAASAWARDPFYHGSLDAPNPAPNPPTPLPPESPELTCAGQPATVVGTPGNDVLVGTEFDDVIVGLDGNDTIRGGGGDDIICGGGGDDSISGDGGADTLFGDRGQDLLRGGYGPDRIFGGSGPDRINGQHGNDVLLGNAGDDVIRGGPHQDTIRGGDHADRLLGQGGRDTIHGERGNDRISGGVGKDTITGGIGFDTCDGGPGQDTLTCESAR